MSDQPAPSILPPNPQVVGGASSTYPPPHKEEGINMDAAKRLAEMGGLMVCAPVELTLQGPDGRPTKVKVSLMDILLQIAQGSGAASMLHPVRRQEEGRDVIVNTSVLQLLAEIADSLNDIACMGQDFLDAQGIVNEEEEEDDDNDDLPAPPRGKKRRYE
jgi:hypothetical protein